jgi:hypothetical protein
LTAREGVETGRVAYAQHFDYAERVSAMGDLLDSALILVCRGKYGHAFNLLRSALEHHAFDLLYMLGRKHTIAFTGISEDDWKEWEADRARGEPWTRHIVNCESPWVSWRLA